VLREEMERLERVQFRDIDYADNFDVMASGVEVFDVPTLSSLSVAAASPLEGYSLSEGSSGLLRGRIPVPLSGDLEKLQALTIRDLDDDGVRVKREQIDLWEAWVQSGLMG